MHLHYMRELADRFEVVAIADIVKANADAVAARYGIGASFGSWPELLESPLDAVLVLTGGSHAPMAMESARRGMHVLVEKPMCYSVAEGAAMLKAAAENNVQLMVGYQKRYDPAYVRYAAEIKRVHDARLMRITTLESPYWPYVAHYGTIAPQPPADDVAAALRADSDDRVTQALGADATASERAIYTNVLLASLVHELNAMRGLLGEPDVIEHASLRPGSLTVLFRFGDLPVTLDRIDLPGMSRYSMEFALYAPERRLTLSFPSPFLRRDPTLVRSEEGEPGTTASSESVEVTSYESAFKRELIAFHDAVVNSTPPATPGSDVIRDIALCRAIILAAHSGQPVERPSVPLL